MTNRRCPECGDSIIFGANICDECHDFGLCQKHFSELNPTGQRRVQIVYFGTFIVAFIAIVTFLITISLTTVSTLYLLFIGLTFVLGVQIFAALIKPYLFDSIYGKYRQKDVVETLESMRGAKKTKVPLKLLPDCHTQNPNREQRLAPHPTGSLRNVATTGKHPQPLRVREGTVQFMCPYCGSECRPAALFCDHCGQSLS